MLVLVFPGQGSERPGMGRPWRDHPSWRLVETVSQATGCDVAHLLLDAEVAEVGRTRNAQIAVFTLSMIALDAVSTAGLCPQACAGYSLGEVSAVVAAGGLSVEDAARVVDERGRVMEGAAQECPGSMIAVFGATESEVAAACAQTGGRAWLAGDDAPGELVMAGSSAGLEEAGRLLESWGMLAVQRLPVVGPFHTPLLDCASRWLRVAVDRVHCRGTQVPVVMNVDGRAHRDAATWSPLLSAQICSPVRWRQAVQWLGGGSFVELGPGRTVSRLVRRILPRSRTAAVNVPDDVAHAVALAAWDALAIDADAALGEDPGIRERVIVSPALGVFQPVAPLDPLLRHDSVIRAGALLGWVAGQEVRSPFTGRLMGMLAPPGSPVVEGEPVAWLRT